MTADHRRSTRRTEQNVSHQASARPIHDLSGTGAPDRYAGSDFPSALVIDESMPTTISAPPKLPKARIGIVDAVLSVLGWVTLLVVSGYSVLVSSTFVMGTANCFGDNVCNTELLGPAIGAVLIGVLVALVAAVSGSVYCIRRRRYSFYWPIISTAAVVACLYIGAALATAAGPQ